MGAGRGDLVKENNGQKQDPKSGLHNTAGSAAREVRLATALGLCKGRAFFQNTRQGVQGQRSTGNVVPTFHGFRDKTNKSVCVESGYNWATL